VAPVALVLAVPPIARPPSDNEAGELFAVLLIHVLLPEVPDPPLVVAPVPPVPIEIYTVCPFVKEKLVSSE
jgi:hypothetical protein